MIYKDPPYPIVDSTQKLPSENIAQYIESNGRNNAIATASMLPIKFCLLTTKGRVSSEWRRTALFYTIYNGSVYTIATNGGSDAAPYWYKNALAYPVVWIQHDFEEYWAICKEIDPELEPELRSVIWDKLNKIYPVYSHYQTLTTRVASIVEIKRI